MKCVNVLRNSLSCVALVICAAVFLAAQQCPQTSTTGPSIPSEVRTLEGRLIYHDGIRKWFELKLDQSQCGQTSIELVGGEHNYVPRAGSSLEVLRGCRVRSKGVIELSPTGYYSLDTFQAVEQIEAVGTCVRQLPFPDYSKAKPDKAIHKYRVDMFVDYAEDHPVAFHVSSDGKELHPWQAYASYWLTGGFVLYAYCAEGFVVDKVFGTAEAEPSHFTESRDPSDAAMFFPESASNSGKKQMHLGYTCVGKP